MSSNPEKGKGQADRGGPPQRRQTGGGREVEVEGFFKRGACRHAPLAFEPASAARERLSVCGVERQLIISMTVRPSCVASFLRSSLGIWIEPPH